MIKGISSELSLILTFLVLILFGTLALKLPFVSHADSLPLLDALFSATSAVCVTGLVTMPTSGFNLAGQLVLLVLMQLGAIGIMTLTSSLILFFRGDINLRMRLEASQLSSSSSLKEGVAILKGIIIYTSAVELIGFAVLFIGFSLDGHDTGSSLYLGLFHAVSAFCNAGFSPLDQSLIGSNTLVKTSVMLLIISGGLGYYVVFDLYEYVKNRDHLSLHTKTVLLLVPLLICAGAGALIFFDRTLPPLDALFQSVTARTAGFNTVPLSGLHTTSLLVLITLMVIGAAPGSTGGGVKITSVFIALFSVYRRLRGNSRIVLFGRSISPENILHAFALLTLYLLLLAIGSLFLLYFEQTPFLATFFEITSALGTVGLSLGLTGSLSAMGKIIIIFSMFIGRIGPAVIVIVLLKSSRASHVDYPEEKIILG